MDNPVSQALQQAIIDEGLGTAPSADSSWPVFVSFLPDEPNNAICVYDTVGNKVGRKMDGTNLKFPACQISIRSNGYNVGWVKADAIESFLEGLSDEEVTIGSNVYEIQAVMQQGTINAIGPEPEGQRRDSFTINVLLEISQTT